MIKNKHHIMSDIESLADSFNHEYQSVNNEIKIYLDDSEIYIVLDNDIKIYEFDNDKPSSFQNLDEALIKLKTIFS
jgi:hypothetical protein|tara:strand:+ start:19 stop:246 length:228 start_codon:yes stop_codon:yes gene_type:complete